MNLPVAAFGLGAYAYSLWILCMLTIWLGGYGEFLPKSLQFILTPFGSIDHNKGWSLSSTITSSLPWHHSLTSWQLFLSNVLPFLLFAAQHNVMALRPFKEFMTSRIYSESAERSIYVFVSSAMLHWTMAAWQPLPRVLISAPGFLAPILRFAPLFGMSLAIASTFHVDHLQLFGVKQAFGIQPRHDFGRTGLYRLIRHPRITGMLIAVWLAPQITVGRLLFASMATAFQLIMLKVIVEPNLLNNFGRAYSEYARDVPAMLPFTGGASFNAPSEKERHHRRAHRVSG